MSTLPNPRQFKRGNTAANDAYTGPAGSLTVDTSRWEIRVHDGITAGGHLVTRLDLLADATTSEAGLMSAADKLKLDGVAAGASANSADTYLLNADNHTPGSTNTPYTISEQTKLAGVEEAATADDLPAEVPNIDITANATTLSIQAWVADLDSRVTALEP